MDFLSLQESDVFGRDYLLVAAKSIVFIWKFVMQKKTICWQAKVYKYTEL